MPSKLLIEAANAFHARHHFDAFGIRGASGLQLDLPAVLRRVRKLRDEFVASTIKATEGLGWRAIDGRARLLAANRIEVNGKVLAARKLIRSEEHTSELQSQSNLVCRLLLEKKKKQN